MPELPPDLSSPSAKNPCYSHVPPLSDRSLGTLRDQIKKIMIPMLIKIFQLKLDLNQKNGLPSRLQSLNKETSSEEIIGQLQNLDEDLNLLMLWCQSSRNQIAKALNPSEEDQKQKITTRAPKSHSDLAVSKSFSAAVSSQGTSNAPHTTFVAKAITPLKQKATFASRWLSLFKR